MGGPSEDERYRLLFERNPIPMWMYEIASLRFVEVNEAAVQVYGYTRAEFLAMTIADIRPTEDLGDLHEDVAQAHGLAPPRVWRHRRKDGELISVEIKANDFVHAGHEVRLVVATDVTERERAAQLHRKTEEQLRHSQKMDAIGKLAGGVAHDFNNILTVIGSYARFIEETLDASDPRVADVAEVLRATDRGTRVTRQLLAVSRHSIGQPRPLDLDGVVAELAPMLQRLVGERVKLVVLRGIDVPPVLADIGHLEQVLMNLAVNARDAMAGTGRFTIETRRLVLDEESALTHGAPPGLYATVAATDTGTGMSAETQRQIFEPFFTTKEVGKGTGLGLSIVHGIVAQAGGTISVYSELGHGTTFRVILPATTQAAREGAAAPAEVPATLPAITVLVVDDEPAVRGAVARILREAGCTVLEAASAEEARRACVSHEGPIEVAVLDVVLADGRGDELVAQLCELRPSLTSVLMSGYPLGALSAQTPLAMELLGKPFTHAELRAAVARATTMARPARPLRGRVLVADDDLELRRVIARFLRRRGFEVVEVDDGGGAIAALADGRFDAIVSDVHMPGASGLDLMRAVRAIDPDVPIILMSAKPDVTSATQAIEPGAFRYLTKPFELDALAATIEHGVRAFVLARLRRDALHG